MSVPSILEAANSNSAHKSVEGGRAQQQGLNPQNSKLHGSINIIPGRNRSLFVTRLELNLGDAAQPPTNLLKIIRMHMCVKLVTYQYEISVAFGRCVDNLGLTRKRTEKYL